MTRLESLLKLLAIGGFILRGGEEDWSGWGGVVQGGWGGIEVGWGGWT